MLLSFAVLLALLIGAVDLGSTLGVDREVQASDESCTDAAGSVVRAEEAAPPSRAKVVPNEKKAALQTQRDAVRRAPPCNPALKHVSSRSTMERS